ncbi:MAG: branched-chain amino acid ABC transporter permease [Desulfobacteraceae bacterium]|nr:MAG: branched-chain amino acid ABC transporter permease [Desulfobacteraceae bacterium]
MKDLLSSKSKIAGMILAVLILMVLPPFYSSYWVTLLTQMLIFAVLAMSLDILLGYTGLSSFGHAGFFGVAGYVVAILSTRYQTGFLICFISGVFLPVFISMIFGFLVAHAAGVYFLIITLALGMVLWGLAFRWVSMTGGDNGIAGILRPDIGIPVLLKDPLTFYYFILLFFLISLILMTVLVRSPFGHSLKGIRESESRMRVLGYHSWLHKYLGYVAAAAFAGAAGVFWAYFNGFISPFDMDLNASIEIVLMVILGGPGTLIGPALGAGIIIFLKNFISAYTQRWLLILGTIYILTILYAPQGLMNLLQSRLKRRRKDACEKTWMDEDGRFENRTG